MKTILRILVILLIGVLVAGALYQTIENTSLLSGAGGFSEGASEFGTSPAMSARELGTLQDRPGGDAVHHAASLSNGLSGVGTTLAKIGIITVIVLTIQAIFTWLRKRVVYKSPLAA